MTTHRRDILHWAETGELAPDRLLPALRLAQVLPDATDWRRFIDRLLLGLGAALLATGVIFFVAYNWRELGRFARFALVEALIVAALGICWKLGLERPAGKAALAAAALLVGGLLALVGQTYQTGADTWELFAAWAALTLPWALVGRSAALAIGWLAVVNIAAALYTSTFRGLFWWLAGPRETLWALFVIDTAALAWWETARRLALDWLDDRLAPRLLALASGAAITGLAMFAVFQFRDGADATALALWAAWLGAVYAAYRRVVPDLFPLAVGVLSAIVVVACWLARFLSPYGDPGGFLLIALVVVALAVGGAWWLRRVAAEVAA